MSNESGDDRSHREPLGDEEETVDEASLEAVVKSGRRRRVRLLTGAGVLLAALAGGAVLVANLVSDNGPGPTSVPPGTGGESVAVTTTTVHTDTFASVAPATTLPPIFDSVPEIPPAGTVAFDWQRSTLPVPPGMEAWVDWAAATDDGFIAVGMGFDITEFGQEEGPTPTTIPGDDDFGPRLLVWESKDGLTWDLIEGVEGFPTNIGELFEVVVTDAGLTAIGMVFENQPPYRDTPVVLTSRDGRTWNSTDLTADLQENEQMYLYQSVAGAGGTLAVGSIDFYPPEPPIVIQRDGKTLTIDNNEFTLTIIDDATGAVLYEGTPDNIYGLGGETEEGLAVYDPETRDLLFVIPWEELDREFEGETVTFERNGYRLVGNLAENTYRVEDATTDEELFSDSAESLFRGPPPRFVDAEGNIILEFTWEEFNRAQEEAYQDFEEDFEDQYYSRPVAFFSPDGKAWSQVELGPLAGNQNAWVNALAAGPNSFLLTGNVDNRDTGQVLPVVWSSTNGVDWQTTPAGEVGSHLHSLLGTTTGFLALGPGGEDRSAVYSSTDGVEWAPVLSVGGPERTSTDFHNIARGGLGIFVTGERYTNVGEFEGHGEPFTTEIEFFTEEGAPMRLFISGDFVEIVDIDADTSVVFGVIHDLDTGRVEFVDEFHLARFYDEAGNLLLEIDQDALFGEVGVPSTAPATTQAPATAPPTTVSHAGDEEAPTTTVAHAGEPGADPLERPAVDASGSAPTSSTPVPDFAGAVAGDDGVGPLSLGAVNELPGEDFLDFLFEECAWPGVEDCFRDAHFMSLDNPPEGSGEWMAGRPFHVRHGFINNGEEPLGEGFDVVVYVTPMDDAPSESGGVPAGATIRYTSDYVLRDTTDQCGPTYKSQTEPVTCEWFVHDFADGLPEGRYALWAVWEAPCSAWVDLGFADTCSDPNQVMALFSSGVDSPIHPVDFDDHEEFAPPEILFYYSADAVTFYEVAADELLAAIFVSQVAVGDDRVVLIVDEFMSEEHFEEGVFEPRAPVVLVGKLAS